MKICFFARVRDKGLFDVVEFYKVDIDALRDLGHEVVCVNTFWKLFTVRCDLYFVWWFGYGVFPVLWGKLFKKSSILVGAVHTNSIDCGGLASHPLLNKWLMMMAMYLADRTLFISKTDLAKVGEFRPSKPEVVYCAVDIQKYCPGNGTKSDVIVTITHLTKENISRKMLLESIEAFAGFAKSHPTYQYHICGSFGSGVESVRSKIRECDVGNSVVLHGRITDVEKIKILRTARAYLQPSTCEGFGLAILEAKACGTPVVTNREPCIMEINGDSVVYGDSVFDMEQGLARLADDSTFYSEMCKRGIENSRKYSMPIRREALRKVLASLDF